MKKSIALALSALLASSMLSGCLGSPTTPPTTAATTTPAAQQQEETAPAEVPDAVSAASPKESSDPADIAAGLSEGGFWIFAVLSDVTIPEDLVVSGTFYDKDDVSSKVYRKLALYAQDEAHTVTANYTLTVPNIVVNSPNFRIQNGTVIGNIQVNAEGFELVGSTIEGDVTFATQELLDSALLGEGTVNGTVSVA